MLLFVAFCYAFSQRVGEKEPPKNIYISKDICPTKDEVIKNDEEHEIISVEDGGDKWICSVTPETWNKYYN